MMVMPAVFHNICICWIDCVRIIKQERAVMVKIVGALVAFVISVTALADDWKFFQSAQISSIVQWQGNNPVLFEVAPNTYCHLPPEDKTNIALVMMLYSTGRKADIHCFPTAVNVGGINAYPMHRIIAR